MGQGEILKILEKENKWLSSRDISNLTGVGLSSTRVKLRKLRILNMVDFKKEDQEYYYKNKER